MMATLAFNELIESPSAFNQRENIVSISDIEVTVKLVNLFSEWR